MRISSLPIEFRAIVNSNSGMKQYLSSLERGRDATPRSWLYESMDPDDILASWKKKLDVLTTGSTQEKEVFRFDSAQESKWGPQGKVAPMADLLEELIVPTFTGNASKFASPQMMQVFNSRLWELAIKLCADKILEATGLRKHSLSPQSVNQVIVTLASTDKLETNSGWPEFTRRSKSSRSIRDAQTGAWKEYPAIVLFRNYNQKTRPVWMMPMATNLVEASFANPVKEAIQNAKYPLTFFASWKGYEHVLLEQTKLYSGISGYVRHLSATDFSHTDENFHPMLTKQVYRLLCNFFQPCYHAALLESLMHMHNIPIVVGLDSIIYGTHGVSSGSVWTNDVETYFDFIWTTYLRLLTQQRWWSKARYPALDHQSGIGIGDDILWVLDKQANLSEFPSFASEQAAKVGMFINEEKVTNSSSYVKYLQRLVQPGYFSDRTFNNRKLLRGVYSTIRALKSLVYPERFHSPKLWSKDMFAVRCFMILENCIDHPLFAEFVKFVCDGHPYLTEFAKKSASEIDSAQASSKLLPGFNPTYNQEKKDSKLSDFASIRIARSF